MAFPANAAAWRTIKWLLKKSPEVLGPLALYLMDQLQDDADVDDLGFHRVVVRYARLTPAGTREDFAQYKFDVVNITNGAVDTTWTGADFTAVTNAVKTYMGAVLPLQSAAHTQDTIRFYRMRFNDSDPGPGSGPKSTSRPFQDTGPPVYIGTTLGNAGSVAAVQPYQVSYTTTFRTAWPKHWGRVYLPGASSVLSTSGRITAANMKILADAAFDLQDDLSAAGFLLTVPVGQVNKQRFHALLGVDKVVVDDVPDVIRRRRAKQPAVRTVGVE